jgi:hypothetical protein
VAAANIGGNLQGETQPKHRHGCPTAIYTAAMQAGLLSSASLNLIHDSHR